MKSVCVPVTGFKLISWLIFVDTNTAKLTMSSLSQEQLVSEYVLTYLLLSLSSMSIYS